MAAAAEVQALLRFLTKDARLSLAEAMGKVNDLRKNQLNTPESISKAPEASLKSIFTDDKTLKQVTNAAKRLANPKKRVLPQNTSSGPSAAKKLKGGQDPDDYEASLALPTTELSVDELSKITLETNRAPLFLAFTVVALAYTHPGQPLSSRLSLAQAVISVSAASRAKYLGINSGPTAEEDGWAQGQPKLEVMGREIAVMRRHVAVAPTGDESDTNPTTAFWGLDLDALRKSNGPLIGSDDKKISSGPPVHKPESARQYLLKSMILVDPNPAGDDDSQRTISATPTKKEKPAEIARKKEQAAAAVLKAIDLLCQSWASTLTTKELDQRASMWYARVRPEIADGKAGWGQRGLLRLRDILDLRK